MCVLLQKKYSFKMQLFAGYVRSCLSWNDELCCGNLRIFREMKTKCEINWDFMGSTVIIFKIYSLYCLQKIEMDKDFFNPVFSLIWSTRCNDQSSIDKFDSYYGIRILSDEASVSWRLWIILMFSLADNSAVCQQFQNFQCNLDRTYIGESSQLSGQSLVLLRPGL